VSMPRILGAIVVLLVLAACSAAPRARGEAASTEGLARTMEPTTAPRPIDPSIQPESKSSLSAGARRALQYCLLVEGDQLIAATERVAGFGRVEHARDIGKYAPFHEASLVLRVDAPAWVLTTNTTFAMPAARGLRRVGGSSGSEPLFVEPTCVVFPAGTDPDHSGWYLTGGALLDGKLVQKLDPANPPTLRLPPLGP
jgi:hypothetical protein